MLRFHVRRWLWWRLSYHGMALLCSEWCCYRWGIVHFLHAMTWMFLHDPAVILYVNILFPAPATLVQLDILRKCTFSIVLQCDPYFDQVGCKHPGCEPAYPTPLCEKKCKVQNQVWLEKKHFSVNAYRVNSDPHDIMAEVYQNGPVEVAFTVYEVPLTFYFFSMLFHQIVDCWLAEIKMDCRLQLLLCHFQIKYDVQNIKLLKKSFTYRDKA